MFRLPLAKRTETLALEISVRDNSHDRSMGHIEIQVVEVAPNYERRVPSDDNRWFEDGRPYSRVLPLKDLLIAGYLRDEEPGAWGRRVEFARPFSVDLECARGMVDTLEKIEKGLARLEAKAGYAATFGAYVQRVATVLGISLVYRGQAAVSPVVTGIENAVDRAISEWHEAHPAPVSQAS